MKRLLALTAFFLSGFSGLVYEICWVREASLVFGSTTAALSTVLATFFAGLALGSWLFGGLAQRTTHPLRIYVILEVALAGLATVSPWMFDLADQLYGVGYRAWSEQAELLAVARIGVVALLLLLPTILMGGTLPLFCRQFVTDARRITGSVGMLYGINTLGGACGCMAAGFVLLPSLGVHGAILVGVAANLVAAVAVGLLRLPAPPVADRPHADTRDDPLPRTRLVGALFFATGLVGVGSQVLWARYLALLVRNSVYTYTITLTVVLLGIVLGSLAARLFERRRNHTQIFGALQCGLGLSVLLLMHLPPSVWRSLGEGDLWIYLLLMLPPSLCSGASFPLGIRLVLHEATRAGRTVGRMTALNTAGGITGAVVIGYLALPTIGLAPSLLVVTGISVLGGIATWLVVGRGRRPLALTAAGLVAAAWAVIPWLLDTRIPSDFAGPRHAVVALSEGAGSTLTLLRDDGVHRLYLDRWWQGDDRRNHQIMAAHIPMLTAPTTPRDVLVIGVGAGQAPGRFLMHDIARLDCVDLEPAIFPFLAEHLDGNAWMEDPRVRLIHEDGRSYVAHGVTRYDLISIEVGQLFFPGVASFYTTEFYQRARARLTPGGRIAQFVPLAFLRPIDLQRVVRTFVGTFPAATLWYNTQELLLIGGETGTAIDTQRMAELLHDEDVMADLRYHPWGGTQRWLCDPANLLACLLCGPEQLAALAGDVDPLSDALPELEYAASAVPETARNELADVDLLRAHLSPLHAACTPPLPEHPWAEIEARREDNLRNLEARAHLRRGEQERRAGNADAARSLLEQAVTASPDDPACLRGLAAVSEPDRAAALYRRALAQDPDDALSHRELGLLQLRAGALDEAVPHLERAVALRPFDAVAHNYLGAALARAGRAEPSIRHLERALTLWPGYPSAREHLAKVREAIGNAYEPGRDAVR